MNDLTQILAQLEELTKRVAALEAELANKANKPIFCGPNPIIPKIDDYHQIMGKCIDGHTEIIGPLVFDTDASDLIRAARAEYEKNKENLLQKWRDNPETAPTYTD